MPFSAAIFWAEGITVGAEGAGFAFTSLTSSFFETTPEAFPSVSILAMTSPATTVPLSPLRMLTSTPSAGAGSSSTTLSVSMSMRFSSRLTASPCFLCQARSVASATDSESCGTFTSMSIFLPLLASRALHRHHQVVGQRSERSLDERLLLLLVQRHIARRGRGRGGAHGVGQHLVAAHVPQQVMLDAVPRALVAGLFLAPDHFGRLRIQVHLRLEFVVRERIELGDAHDGDILQALFLARRHDVEEHLAAAYDDALDVGRLDALVPLAVDRLELAFGEFGQRRDGFLVTQQALGREDDERLAVGPDHLPAQQEEHLHRRGRDAHLDLVDAAPLPEAPRTAGAAVGPLPFVAVRQHHHHAADAAPLDLARGDELVDHHLRAVDEVAELRLPDHELVWLRGRVAEFEAEHRLFRQHRIDDHEIALVGRDVRERDVAARVPLLAVLVVQHRVAVEEGAAPGVLS